MRKTLAGLVLALAAAPFSVHAEVATDAFAKLCVATGGAPAEVKAEARTEGFVTPPPEMAAKMAIPTISNATALWKQVEGGLMFVVWGLGQSPVGGATMKADVCAVVVTPALADPTKSLQASLNVGPPQAAGPAELFVYTETGAAKTAVKADDMAAVLAGIGTGHLRFVIGQNQQNLTTLMVMSPKELSQ